MYAKCKISLIDNFVHTTSLYTPPRTSPLRDTARIALELRPQRSAQRVHDLVEVDLIELLKGVEASAPGQAPRDPTRRLSVLSGIDSTGGTLTSLVR